MFRLSLIIGFLLIFFNLEAQIERTKDSPHGPTLQIDCKKCHTTEGWKLDPASITFDHDSTNFSLRGQHISTDCKACHQTLVFDQAPTDCFQCHTDIHQETVGMDCARCHDSQSWLIDDISVIHEQLAFPLEGVHFGLECRQCHTSATELTFYPILNECITCHQQDFDNTMDPDHTAAEYSTNCAECHSLHSFDWSADNYNHDFFPLTLGHDIKECSACHEDNIFQNLPTDCYYCHQQDFENSISPNHINGNFSTSCVDCHTTNPEWKPASYEQHDALYFPIYQGKHAGEWDDCAECHTSQDNYSEFSCIHCHEHNQSGTDDEHEDVTGYLYESKACYACHPTGDENFIFNHDNSNFPLTGFHRQVECADCHMDGYLGTPTDCFACHEKDYENSTNPDHKVLNISTDCASCHTTDPNWVPARFDIHNEYYTLAGAHIAIANDCFSCHNGDYNNTPTDCYGCHKAEYENTQDPSHELLQFSTDCATCHSEDAWEPSTFEHDMAYFPIFSGSHQGEWTNCNECHTQPDNYLVFNCTQCHAHEKTETDDEHIGVAGYIYESQACYACHPTGTADDVFDHNLTGFPLTGAHLGTDCLECHADGFSGTPTECMACHTEDFNSTSNPNHITLGLSTDCTTCHTTDPEWKPALFDIHDEFHPLLGAHQLIKNDCASCHQDNYTNTPNTCAGCHIEEFNQTLDPPHVNLQFSTDCRECHTESSWTPSTFNHDDQYFPVFTGKHMGEWNDCTDCHTNSADYSIFTCTSCHAHQQTEMDEEHQGIGGYIYESNACLACHPTGDAENGFDHNLTAFPLTGAHVDTDCILCHMNGYQGTPSDCLACHEQDYNQSINPDHQALAIHTDCAQCHTTEPSWAPATFDIHDEYYPLTGAHVLIANDCAACHNGDYNNTGSDCAACHTIDYNNSSNPNHQQLAIPLDCASCHTTDPGWQPATFDIHDNYYPLNGAHALIASDCAACHGGDYNNTPNTCFACHEHEYNQTTNPSHSQAQFGTECASCHTETAWEPSTFDHDGMYFPIYSGEHQGEWSQCSDCHTIENNYAIFTCISCHINPETDVEHEGVGGYVYSDQACLACHPTGSADDNFNHDNTGFQLNGGHDGLDCLDCHAGGYENTSSECVSCHQIDFDQTINPNHGQLEISTDCASCHTTDPGWSPATFEIHNDFYPLTGAHQMISNDCTACHNGDYNNTPNDCESCHIAEYNSSTNPDHQLLGIPTTCESCHNTDPAWSPASFEIHDDYYPLTGAHQLISNDCAACHDGDYNNTPDDCAGCHIGDYNASTNPDHGVLGLSINCNACHTTDPGWSPASFDDHDTYYVLTGAHIPIANDCALCHNGDYNNTSNTCEGCHMADYNTSSNPDHQSLNLSTDCATCHSTQAGWNPATFDIHDEYYVFTGAHIPIANDCAICHNGDYVNTSSACESCHMADYNSSSNPDHQNLGISTDCAGCHTTDPGWSPASFDVHDEYYPLTGAHLVIASDCVICHNGDYNNTPSECVDCHIDDYNATTSPDHQELNLSYDCAGCHTTDPDWTPATFDVHNDYYPLTGAHAIIANDCILCHQNGYDNTPNTCFGCHEDDYNNTVDPNHSLAQFPIDCELCHSDVAWTPSTFDHDGMYFPIYSGKHDQEWNECADCHTVQTNYSIFDCLGCHTNPETDEDHDEVNDYSYDSPSCFACHPDGES